MYVSFPFLPDGYLLQSYFDGSKFCGLLFDRCLLQPNWYWLQSINSQLQSLSCLICCLLVALSWSLVVVVCCYICRLGLLASALINLLFVGCWLLSVGCLMVPDGCWMPSVECLFVPDGCWLPFVNCLLADVSLLWC